MGLILQAYHQFSYIAQDLDNFLKHVSKTSYSTSAHNHKRA